MSHNRNGNGMGPLMAGQEFRKVIESAADQGRRQGQQEVMQALQQAFPAVLQSELGPDVDGKRAITSKPFADDLAYPVTIGLPGRIHVLGGMTKRLAVAASIVGHCSAAGQDNAMACRNALDLADVLIAQERADRTPKAPTEEPAQS